MSTQAASPAEGKIHPFRGFNPLPTQGRFLAWVGRYPDIRLLSSGYGGGKSSVGCRESIRHALGFAGSRHVVARFHSVDLTYTTQVSYFEALERIGLSDGSKPGMRHYIWNKSDRTIYWWNGSQTMFLNLDDPTGAKYGSLEVSTIFVDEGFEVPDEVYYVLYPSRLRWHLEGCEYREKLEPLIAAGYDVEALGCDCPRRMWVCTNPGDSGFLKDIVRGKMDPEEAAWFPVPPGENIYAGPQYHETMARIAKMRGPHYYERFINGSWDAFEGQRFTMLEREAHFLPHDMRPHQSEYDIIEGHDFGFRNAHAIVWIAVHKEREYPPFVVDDYEEPEREIPDIAEDVKARRALYGWDSREILAVGDPAGSQVRGTGMSDIMLFATHGVEIIPMHRSKNPGPRADLIAMMLSREVKTRGGMTRGLTFCPRAHRTFDRLLEYRYAEKSRTSKEDPPEKFQKRDDHLVDALGHGVSAIPDPLEDDEPPEKPWEDEVRRRRLPTPEELDRLETGG